MIDIDWLIDYWLNWLIKNLIADVNYFYWLFIDELIELSVANVIDLHRLNYLLTDLIDWCLIWLLTNLLCSRTPAQQKDDIACLIFIIKPWQTPAGVCCRLFLCHWSQRINVTLRQASAVWSVVVIITSIGLNVRSDIFVI